MQIFWLASRCLPSAAVIMSSPNLVYLQRQHHHQHHQLCYQCLCRFCHLLYPRLHGSSPGSRCFQGGQPRPWLGICGLSWGIDTPPRFPFLVCSLLLHAHPAGAGYTGKHSYLQLMLWGNSGETCLKATTPAKAKLANKHKWKIVCVYYMYECVFVKMQITCIYIYI